MFYELVVRNSRRNRKENGLFFASVLVSIVAFYIILSLPRQDVMLFLAKMESDAVDRLFGLIPLFFQATLFLLFFLIYYAEKYQMERRRHEFGIYLMMGMRRWKLFAMLLAEDFGGGLLALLVGVPGAVLLGELVSLVTARVVGLGILGHRFSFSIQAVFGTAVGFLVIKLAAFLILSGKIAGQEIGSLLSEQPGGMKKQRPAAVSFLAFAVGVVFLGRAYALAISESAWQDIGGMGLTLLLGISGTFLFFYGLRAPMGVLAGHGGKNRGLRVFNFRQLQENVILRSNTLAVSSLLMLAAMCCFGAGVGIASFQGNSQPHVLDYTFSGQAETAEKIGQVLREKGLESCFSKLFEIRLGFVKTTEGYENVFQMDSVMTALSELPESRDRDVLLNNLGYADYPYLIALSGYNELLAVSGEPALELGEGELGVYMDHESAQYSRKALLDSILESRPEVFLDGRAFHLTGEIQTTNLVTDRSIAISFALIVPDELFDFYNKGNYSIYVNGILNREAFGGSSLMNAIMEMNENLAQTDLEYESYLQNMGRQLFYMVAACYVTIYLAVIFLIIANTVLGVQFLMTQRKSGRRYRTLIRLGATREVLCRSAGKQVVWYFGIPSAVAVFSSFFGVLALFAGFLPSGAKGNIPEMMKISAAMILLLVVIECIYVMAVRRFGSRYILSLMAPEREE